jgi:hypothetical protein
MRWRTKFDSQLGQNIGVLAYTINMAVADKAVVPLVSARLGLPVIPSSSNLLKSYESEVSEQLAVLLGKLPKLEAPFRFFKYTYFAYDSWLNSISGILAVENPAEELFDRLEWALSGYLHQRLRSILEPSKL